MIEDLPVEDSWADVVISNGVINLCADKDRVFKEIIRVLKPGGRLQFADIATGKTVPEAATRNIDLWTELVVGVAGFHWNLATSSAPSSKCAGSPIKKRSQTRLRPIPRR